MGNVIVIIIIVILVMLACFGIWKSKKNGRRCVGCPYSVEGVCKRGLCSKGSDIMDYRLGTLEDIDSIVALIQDAVKEMERNEIYQWDNIYPNRKDFEEDIKKGTLYIVMDGRDLVALYVISREYDEAYEKCEWKNSDEGSFILHRFCVSPKFQNRGFGKKILNHIEDQIKLMGYSSVRLDVFTENPYALRLYRNNGYEERGFADWRKGRFLLMEKNLMG